MGNGAVLNNSGVFNIRNDVFYQLSNRSPDTAVMERNDLRFAITSGFLVRTGKP